MSPNLPAARIAEHHAPDAIALAGQLAAAVADALRSAIAARGRAVLAVSGGRGAPAWFEALSAAALPWAAVTIVMVDERWVAADDPASNGGLVRRHLLQQEARAATWLPLQTDAGLTLEAAVAQYDAALDALPLPLDVAVLGMGEDGHTASIFPDADKLDTLLELPSAQHCHATRPPGLAQARMTLGLSTLAAARELMLSFAGAGKWQVYQRAVTQQPPALPMARLLAAASGAVTVWTTP